MTKSHMTEVANMLGVNLNEEFEVNIDGAVIKAQITSKDIHLLDYPHYWGGYSSADLLRGLLRGDYTIKHKPSRPHYGDIYQSVSPHGKVEAIKWTDDVYDVVMYKLGNCYYTALEAEANKTKWINFYASDEVLEV